MCILYAGVPLFRVLLARIPVPFHELVCQIPINTSGWYWKQDVRVLRGRMRLKCDGTRAETRFCLSAKRTSLFKSAGASVQSTTGIRVVGISRSNAGYTKFRGSERYWPPTPFASFPFTSSPVRHHVQSRFNWTLQQARISDSLLRHISLANYWINVNIG